MFSPCPIFVLSLYVRPVMTLIKKLLGLTDSRYNAHICWSCLLLPRGQFWVYEMLLPHNRKCSNPYCKRSAGALCFEFITNPWNCQVYEDFYSKFTWTTHYRWEFTTFLYDTPIYRITLWSINYRRTPTIVSDGLNSIKNL